MARNENNGKQSGDKGMGQFGGGNGDWGGMSREVRLTLGYAILALIGVVLLQSAITSFTEVEQIPYSEFRTELEKGNVKSVEVGSETLRGSYVEDVEGKGSFVTRRVEGDIVDELENAGVEYDGVVEDTIWGEILSWLIPIGLFFALWWFVIRRMVAQQGGMGSQMMQIGKSKARVSYEEDTGTRFSDVAGIDEAKEDMREIVSFLTDIDHYSRLGAQVPKGVLLTGPPGTGKTLLARAVAGEAKVPFFYINGSEFVEMFVGVGASRVRDLFKQAAEQAPAIIFIDELDALGAARGSRPGMAGGGNDEKEQTLNQLLSELDGFDPNTGLVVMGATNRSEVLDPALLRAGRFDRRVLVPRPDRKGRVEILKVHSRKVTLTGDVDLDIVARLTTGFTGADLENLVNEAALLATWRDAEGVAQQDFTAAIERIVAGKEKKNRPLSEDERVRVAYHELGHALLGLALPGADPVQKVSIVPRSIGALGYTMSRPTEDRFLLTKGELIDKITVLLAGRAAEQVFFDDISTGASDDLRRVTQLARSMVSQYGMTDELGLLAYEDGQETSGGLPPGLQGRDYAEETARQIDETARAIVDRAYARAIEVIEAHRDDLDREAQHLLDVETVEEDDLRRAFGMEKDKKEEKTEG